MDFISRISSLSVCFIGPLLFYFLFSGIASLSRNIITVIGNPQDPKQFYFLMLILFFFMIKLTMHFEKELEPTAYHTLVQASSWLIISGNFIGVIVTALLFFQSL